ncbi:MAG: preprotein translocase subunit SecG [Planctomycetota bacterium]
MLMLGSFGTVLVTIGMVSVAILMIGLILLQKNRGSGLSGAFGGVGGHTAFGTKTGDFLTWVTVGLTTVFLLLAIIGNYVFEPVKSVTATQTQTPPPPGATPGQPSGAPPVQLQTTPIPNAPGSGAPAAPVTLTPVTTPLTAAPTTQPS